MSRILLESLSNSCQTPNSIMNIWCQNFQRIISHNWFALSHITNFSAFNRFSSHSSLLWKFKVWKYIGPKHFLFKEAPLCFEGRVSSQINITFTEPPSERLKQPCCWSPSTMCFTLLLQCDSARGKAPKYSSAAVRWLYYHTRSILYTTIKRKKLKIQ